MFEKLYQKNVAKGFPITVCVTNGLEYHSLGIQDENSVPTKLYIDEMKEKLSNSYMGECEPMVYVFKNPLDFSITV